MSIGPYDGPFGWMWPYSDWMPVEDKWVTLYNGPCYGSIGVMTPKFALPWRIDWRISSSTFPYSHETDGEDIIDWRTGLMLAEPGPSIVLEVRTADDHYGYMRGWSMSVWPRIRSLNEAPPAAHV